MADRVFDVPSYVVAPCGQVLRECGRAAVDAMLAGNATLLAETVGGSVDGVVLTSPQNPYFEAFTFSAASDPGAGGEGGGAMGAGTGRPAPELLLGTAQRRTIPG